MKRKSKLIEYDIEQSPFYNDKIKLRASLEELRASHGDDVVTFVDVERSGVVVTTYLISS